MMIKWFFVALFFFYLQEVAARASDAAFEASKIGSDVAKTDSLSQGEDTNVRIKRNALRTQEENPNNIEKDLSRDESILIGAIAGLPTPAGKSISNSQNNRNPKSNKFDQGSVSTRFNTQEGVNKPQSNTIFHNFPNNNQPRFKIVEVRPALQNSHNQQPKIFNRRREHIHRNRNSESQVGSSLFVNSNDGAIPISQSTKNGQEGPIIVHSNNRPELLHLDNTFFNRLGAVNTPGASNQFRRSFQLNKEPVVHFSFPSSLFPVRGGSPVSTGSQNPSRTSNFQKNIHKNSQRNHGSRKISHSENNRGRTPAPRTTRHSSGSNFLPTTTPHNRLPPRIIPAVIAGTQGASGSQPQTFVIARPELNRPFLHQQKTAHSPAEYSYGYTVDDRVTGDQKRVFETLGLDGIVRGQYSFLQPDGLYRVVTYTADELNGFRADVEYLPTNVRLAGS